MASETTFGHDFWYHFWSWLQVPLPVMTSSTTSGHDFRYHFQSWLPVSLPVMTSSATSSHDFRCHFRSWLPVMTSGVTSGHDFWYHFRSWLPVPLPVLTSGVTSGHDFRYHFQYHGSSLPVLLHVAPNCGLSHIVLVNKRNMSLLEVDDPPVCPCENFRPFDHFVLSGQSEVDKCATHLDLLYRIMTNNRWFQIMIILTMSI